MNAIQEDKEAFDLLKWWKINSERFHILGKMARDILAVPFLTVASKSAFSTGGRVLAPFRSSLTPKIMESLTCAQEWICSLNCPINVEEGLEEHEKLEEGSQKLLPAAPHLRMFLDLVGLLKIKLLEI
ncbi:hypothetical protein GH714_010018 [Hevea brasiliensis]|uniref:HAT C-terminal dimerisation domain-containing protein n=1 Tax=Hevea brasiliensis TaxID=3981 RepID=A0A6A6L667_HEVBR|nr:hypothetical protein GH714_010018 [Hevea brasiliensis]